MADKLTYGGCYFSTPAETTLSAATPAKAAGTTTLSPVGNGFTMPANNRLQLDAGQTTRDYQILSAFSVSKAGGGAALGSFYIALNGTVIATSEIQRSLANTSDIGAVVIGVSAELSAGDYVEMWVETDNGDNLTVIKGGMGVRVLG